MTQTQPFSLPKEAEHWGAVQSEHLSSKKRLTATYAMTALLAPFALGCFALGSVVSPKERAVALPFGIFLGVVLVAMMVFMIYQARRSSDWRVLVFPEGVVFGTQRNGGSGSGSGSGGDAFPWDKITSIRQQIVRNVVNGVPVGTTHNYIICRNDGKEVRFGDLLSNAETLGETIQREAFPFLMRRARLAFDAGQAVSFGKLSVSKNGVNNGKETLLWADIEAVQVADGVIQVRKRGKWLRWSHVLVSEMPNVFVFLALCKAEQGGVSAPPG